MRTEAINLPALLSFYLRERLPTCKPRTAAKYRTVLKWLRHFLGRDATTADLSVKMVAEFWKFCFRRGIARSEISRYGGHIRALWQYAVDRGFLAECPELPPITGRLAKVETNRAPVPGSIDHYYWHTFRPNELKNFSTYTVRGYDYAVREFRHFNGGYSGTDMGQITNKLLEAFRAHMAARVPKAAAYRAYSRVRAIMRHAEPLRFPKQHGWNKITETDAPDGSLRRFFETIYVGEHELAPGTRQQYHLVITLLRRWLGHEPMLAELSDILVNQFLSAQAERRAAAGLRAVRNTLLTLWRSAFQWELVDKEPRRVRKIRVLPPIPDAFTPDELSRLVGATYRIRTAVRQNRGLDRGARLRAFIFLAYDTGFRPSDVNAVKWSDVDPQTGIVAIRMQKTGFPITRRVRPVTLQAMREIRSDANVFEPRWSKKSLLITWRALLKLAALPVHRRNGPQKLRRSAATHLGRQEGKRAATELLGHQSEDLAQRSYLDPFQAYAPPPLPPEIPQPPKIAGLLPAPEKGDAA